MKYGSKFGLWDINDVFGYGLDTSYVDYGCYGDKAVSAPPVQHSSPVASFGYNWPVVEQRHHYDVSYYSSNYAESGPFAWGDYQFSNFAIDTVDYYSIFGHTSMYHISSSSGYGSWFSAPGYQVSSGHYWTSETAGIHTDSIWGSSDTFAFRNTESDYSHLQIGNLAIDNSHLEIHEGAGRHENSWFAQLDSFAFRDTVIDSQHVQIGDFAIDSFHSDVRGGSQTVYANYFGGYGIASESSVAIHDQSTVQGNGFYEQHVSDYSCHTSDVTAIGVPAYMVSAPQVDHMGFVLG